MYKRKRAGNTITRKINSTKDTAAKADKNHYISNSYLEGFIPIDTEYFTASLIPLPSSAYPHTSSSSIKSPIKLNPINPHYYFPFIQTPSSFHIFSPFRRPLTSQGKGAVFL